MTDLERRLLDALAELIACDFLRRREQPSAEGETA
jgi:hypothetical protein